MPDKIFLKLGDDYEVLIELDLVIKELQDFHENPLSSQCIVRITSCYERALMQAYDSVYGNESNNRLFIDNLVIFLCQELNAYYRAIFDLEYLFDYCDSDDEKKILKKALASDSNLSNILFTIKTLDIPPSNFFHYLLSLSEQDRSEYSAAFRRIYENFLSKIKEKVATPEQFLHILLKHKLVASIDEIFDKLNCIKQNNEETVDALVSYVLNFLNDPAVPNENLYDFLSGHLEELSPFEFIPLEDDVRQKFLEKDFKDIVKVTKYVPIAQLIKIAKETPIIFDRLFQFAAEDRLEDFKDIVVSRYRLFLADQKSSMPTVKASDPTLQSSILKAQRRA